MQSTVDNRDQEKHLLQRLLDDGHAFLSFPAPVESHFCRDYMERNIGVMRLALLVAVILFFVSTIFDLIFILDWRLSILIRFAIIAPLFVGILVFMYSKLFLRYRELLMSFAVVIVAAGVICLALVQKNPMKDMYFNALLLVVMFVFTLSRLRFWYAFSSAIAILLIFNLALFLDTSVNLYYWLAHNYLYLSGSLILACASYLMEKSMRRQFLQDRLLQLEKLNLLESNMELGERANTDPVSGLANRYLFEKHLDEEWRNATRHRYWLGIMIIDFDLFKEYNDHYGHPAGDEVLQKLALMFETKVSRVNDLVARYGGDEFIVLLQGTDAEGVRAKAETIMRATDKLLIPHKGSRISSHVTLSIGGASMQPTLDQKPGELIEAADKALYQAKQSGRHCIHIA